MIIQNQEQQKIFFYGIFRCLYFKKKLLAYDDKQVNFKLWFVKSLQTMFFLIVGTWHGLFPPSHSRYPLHPPTMYKNACFFHNLSSGVECFIILTGRKWYLSVLISIYLVMSEVEYLFRSLKVIAFLFLWSSHLFGHFFPQQLSPSFQFIKKRRLDLNKLYGGKSRVPSSTKLIMFMGSLGT